MQLTGFGNKLYVCSPSGASAEGATPHHPMATLDQGHLLTPLSKEWVSYSNAAADEGSCVTV